MKRLLPRIACKGSRANFRLLKMISTTQEAKQTCYYEILGVPRDASTEEIRKRFFELAKTHHPDISPDSRSHEIFQRLSEAYGVLSSTALRAEYDLLKNYHRESSTSRTSQESPANEDELFNDLYKKYKASKEREDSELFMRYFKEKYLNADHELKDPLHPLNFYSEMYDQKVKADKKAAEVK